MKNISGQKDAQFCPLSFRRYFVMSHDPPLPHEITLAVGIHASICCIKLYVIVSHLMQTLVLSLS